MIKVNDRFKICMVDNSPITVHKIVKTLNHLDKFSVTSILGHCVKM